VLDIGCLYTDEKGDIFLFEGQDWSDYFRWEKVYKFKVISSKTIKERNVNIPSNYFSYLKILPKNHPAWILYGR
jgi:hypothetical protein